jgi:serine/threonine protein kinase
MESVYQKAPTVIFGSHTPFNPCRRLNDFDPNDKSVINTGRVLGTGGGCVVTRVAKDAADDRVYVFKRFGGVLKRDYEDGLEALEQYLALSREVDDSRHRHIVRLYHIMSRVMRYNGQNPLEYNVYMVSELFNYGTLRSLLFSRDTNQAVYKIPPVIVANIVFQMLMGLRFAEAHGVYHAGLTSAEVVINRSGIVAVKDFVQPKRWHGQFIVGVSKDASYVLSEMGWLFREYYKQPNVPNHSPSRSSSLWAVGIIGFEMLTRKLYWNTDIGLPMRKNRFTSALVGNVHVPSNNVAAILTRCFSAQTTFMDIQQALDPIINTGQSYTSTIAEWLALDFEHIAPFQPIEAVIEDRTVIDLDDGQVAKFDSKDTCEKLQARMQNASPVYSS